MASKWLEMAPWKRKQEEASLRGNGNTVENSKGGKENPMPQVAPLAKPAPAKPAREDNTGFQVELMPMEDIYRAAGIMSPRKGYSINKVVEMLNSEHMRGQSQEMKRMAVLMALDAAGVAIQEVLQDAKVRQDALNAYEAEQKKRAEAEWAQKLEENVQIEAEIERIKAHHTARIHRNLDAVAREKTTFANWQTAKNQASQSMAEAAELCVKAPAPEPAKAPPVEATALKANSAKAM